MSNKVLLTKLNFVICRTKYIWQSQLCFSQKHCKWPLDTLEPLKNLKIKKVENHFVWQRTKVLTLFFVRKKTFSNVRFKRFLEDLRFQEVIYSVFGKNKVKQSWLCQIYFVWQMTKFNFVKSTLFDKWQSLTLFTFFFRTIVF